MNKPPYGWAGYRFRQILLPLAFFGLPIGFILARPPGSSLGEGGSFALSIGWVLLLLLLAWGTGRFACPRCGDAIAGGKWIPSRSIAPLGYPSKCSSCGLRIGANGMQADDSA